MPAKLYVVHGSHPCAAVARAMDMKSVPYKVVELLPPMHAPLQRLRFGARTVPGLTLESGEKISGSRAIMRRLEELAPQPPLFPVDASAREEVERAEAWGDEVWQQIARRVTWGSFARAPQVMPTYQDGTRLPRLPAPAVRAVAPVVGAVERRLNQADPASVRADLVALPGHLDRIDGWLASGVLGGDVVNAADLQIATSSRLMLTFGDMHALFAGRPAEQHARELFPEWPGSAPAGIFPSAWLTGTAQPGH
jgi:glutathione S-transferase